MAIMRRVTWANPRRKKWEHFKLKWRKLTFRLSILLNVGLMLYIKFPELLTNNYVRYVLPIMEAIKLKLPLF
jgi:hypothetical protein